MRLNRILYFGDFVACPVAIAALAVETMPTSNWHGFSGWMVAVAAGFIGWTLLEYVIHRWIYHRYMPFKRYHDMHHDEPSAQVGAPSFVSLFLIFGFIGLPLYDFGAVVAGGITSGVLLGYAAYILVHHAVHHWNPKYGTPLYARRRWHARHHYTQNPSNFGVTTGLWDKVFRTPFNEAEPPRFADRKNANVFEKAMEPRP